MKIKLGPSEGNCGALIRFGRCLDKGIWIRTWNFRSLWTSFRFAPGYLSLGVVCFHW